jgi:hypothetical protein
MGLERVRLRGRLSRRGSSTGAVALASLVALYAPHVAGAQAGHSLTIISPTSLSLTASGKKSSTRTVIVSNDGNAVDDLRFSTVPTGKVKVEVSHQKIGAFAVRNFSVKLTPTKSDPTFKGSLTVGGNGVAPGAIALSLSPSKSAPNWLYFLLIGTALAALVVVVLRYCVFWVAQETSRRPKLTTPLGPVNWDFSKSWASNLTVVGALLGTILAAGVLPDETAVTKATYAGLNLFFGILILVAPLAYVAMQREKQLTVGREVTEPQYRGTVFWFLAASTLTLWAVAGELGTVGFLFRDIRSAQSLPDAAVVAMWALVIAAALLLLIYAWTSMRAILRDQIDLPKHQRRARRRHRSEVLAQLPVVVVEEADLSGLSVEERAAVERTGGRVRVLDVPHDELVGEDEIEPTLPSWSVI